MRKVDKRFVDLTGKRFGRRTMIRLVGRSKDSRQMWEYICDCGKTGITNKGGLKIKPSCGCLSSETTAKRNYIHGMTGTRQFNIWGLMIDRCTNPKSAAYKDYAGRGITVCERWKKFENFWEDMKGSYNEKLMLDRIDNDGNYDPKNCRWATWRVQQNNRRGNRHITYGGETKTIAEWARSININQTTLRVRIVKGWSLDKALSPQKYTNQFDSSKVI